VAAASFPTPWYFLFAVFDNPGHDASGSIGQMIHTVRRLKATLNAADKTVDKEAYHDTECDKNGNHKRELTATQ
jgi:hypothetical protein